MAVKDKSKPAGNALSRRERERLRHEQEILEAAERVFSRKGFFAAQVSEIAREAEFAVGTLYSFFKSKDAIYQRIVEEKVQECLQEYREVAESAGENPRLQLERLIEAKVKYFLQNRAFFQIYVTEFRGMGYSFRKDLREGVASLYDEYLLWLAEIFRRGVKRRMFVDTDPDALATALEAVSNSALVRYLRREQETSPEDMSAAITTILFEGILRK